MYRSIKRTKSFDLNIEKDLLAYDEILNNPMCTILREIKEKIGERSFNDEGKISGFHDRLVLIVTWEEKIFLD